MAIESLVRDPKFVTSVKEYILYSLGCFVSDRDIELKAHKFIEAGQSLI